jgi:hypothetical protein
MPLVSRRTDTEEGKDMRVTLLLAAILATSVLTDPANAQKKTEDECLDIIEKYLGVLAGTLRETKPTGACALARWGKDRHEEILRMYSQEPDECRATELGKNLEKTLKVRISQEDSQSKRHCRRK